MHEREHEETSTSVFPQKRNRAKGKRNGDVATSEVRPCKVRKRAVAKKNHGRKKERILGKL